VEVIDSNADLNAYAKIENQSGCCSPAPAQIKGQSQRCAPAGALMESQAVATAICDAPSEVADTAKLFEKFTDLLTRYNVNDYAASVKVYAVK
jgi:hypothetical protein